tara:strand:- start:414 stop:602 length:189 start_codon:yes stop_codon:yes gene_type:complete
LGGAGMMILGILIFLPQNEHFMATLKRQRASFRLKMRKENAPEPISGGTRWDRHEKPLKNRN